MDSILIRGEPDYNVLLDYTGLINKCFFLHVVILTFSVIKECCVNSKFFDVEHLHEMFGSLFPRSF